MIDVTLGRKTKASLRLDLLKCFGADFQQDIKEPLLFAGENGNSLIYPVGHHISNKRYFYKRRIKKK